MVVSTHPDGTEPDADADADAGSPTHGPGDGDGPGAAGGPDDRYPVPGSGRLSVRSPAFIVVGIAAFIIVLGIVGSALDSGSSPPFTLHTVTLHDGTVVHAGPGATALAPIESDGEPPADVLAGVAVPVGSTPAGAPSDADQNLTQYDRTMPFTVELPADEVADFFRVSLPKLGSTIVSDGPDPYQAGSTEILARRGSGDSFYWEIGVVVSPTSSTGVTPFSVRLYEIPDAD